MAREHYSTQALERALRAREFQLAEDILSKGGVDIDKIFSILDVLLGMHFPSEKLQEVEKDMLALGASLGPLILAIDNPRITEFYTSEIQKYFPPEIAEGRETEETRSLANILKLALIIIKLDSLKTNQPNSVAELKELMRNNAEKISLVVKANPRFRSILPGVQGIFATLNLEKSAAERFNLEAKEEQAAVLPFSLPAYYPQELETALKTGEFQLAKDMLSKAAKVSVEGITAILQALSGMRFPAEKLQKVGGNMLALGARAEELVRAMNNPIMAEILIPEIQSYFPPLIAEGRETEEAYGLAEVLQLALILTELSAFNRNNPDSRDELKELMQQNAAEVISTVEKNPRFRSILPDVQDILAELSSEKAMESSEEPLASSAAALERAAAEEGLVEPAGASSSPPQSSRSSVNFFGDAPSRDDKKAPGGDCRAPVLKVTSSL